jgi:mono/diheme cytochrome c family protein
VERSEATRLPPDPFGYVLAILARRDGRVLFQNPSGRPRKVFAVNERNRFLLFALAIAGAIAVSGVSVGCSSTPPTSPPASPPAQVTPAPSTQATPSSTLATPAVSGLELGKLIFETGKDNAGPIPTTRGMATIKVNACKNCHGANARGGKKLPGPDIRGSALQPDFDEAKFARAVTTGVDDTGKRLHNQMPRFSATAEDTAALWQYLNSLK